jgi:osmotically-inducible protein OsmY
MNRGERQERSRERDGRRQYEGRQYDEGYGRGRSGRERSDFSPQQQAGDFRRERDWRDQPYGEDERGGFRGEGRRQRHDVGGWNELQDAYNRDWDRERGWNSREQGPGRGYGREPYAPGFQQGGLGRGEEETSSGMIGAVKRFFGKHSGRGPKGYTRSDERIREDVCEMLTQDPEVDATEMEIVVADGEVTLMGFVEDRETKRRAEDIAECAPGVKEVHDQLRVSRQESQTQQGRQQTGMGQQGGEMSQGRAGEERGQKPARAH